VTGRQQVWVSAIGIVSLLAAGYAVMAAVFYGWLSAVEPDRWPPGRTNFMVYSCMVHAVLFLVFLVASIVMLFRSAER
jgi:hypothetical protein